MATQADAFGIPRAQIGLDGFDPMVDELTPPADRKVDVTVDDERVAIRTQTTGDAILRVLAVRGLPVTDAQRAKIEACAEIGVLERWLERAVTARSVEEAVG